MQDNRPPLLNIREVLALTPAQAATRVPVRIEGVVTYYQPAEHMLYLQDATGAVYVSSFRSFDIHKGSKVLVVGRTAASYRNTVWSNHVTSIGEAPMPVPKPAHFSSLINGEIDCDYVRVRGVVRSATLQPFNGTPFLLLEILSDGGPESVHVLNFKGVNPYDLLDSEIAFDAASGKTFDGKFEPVGVNLYVDKLSDIRVLSHAAVKPLDFPVSSFSRVVETYRVNNQGGRVRVLGTVTLSVPGEMLVLDQGGKTLLVHTRQNDPVPVGQVVDATGFSDFDDYGPSLNYAQFVPTDKAEKVASRPVSYAQALSGVYGFNVVSLTGALVEEVNEAQKDTLVVRSGDHIFSAVFRSKTNLPALKVGTTIRVTGVCFITSWGPYHNPSDFTIQMRSPADVEVLVLPSRLTVRNLAVVVGLLLAVAVLALAWGAMLRRRVAKQTTIIQLAREEEAARERRVISLEKERGQVLEAINSSQPLESVLALIAAFIEDQVSDVACSFGIAHPRGPVTGLQAVAQPDRATPPDEQRGAPEPGEAGGDASVTRRSIQSSDGVKIAEMSLSAKGELPASSHFEEVVEIGSRLAALAIENRMLHERLVYRSEYDQLTDVPNRFLLEYRLQQSIEAARKSGTRLAVIYIDLDEFKQVNDRFGHRIGDLYLQQAAQRLAAQLRAQDLLARIGGDEFLAVVLDVSGQEEVDAVVERLFGCFADPFTLEDLRIMGAASIGVAMYPEDGEHGEELKRTADHAMYAQKRRSKQAAVSNAS